MVDGRARPSDGGRRGPDKAAHPRPFSRRSDGSQTPRWSKRVNWLLLSTGLAKKPVTLLYSETAVVIGSLHVFFPMMVLPVASALGRIDPRLEDAARTLGATAWRSFRRITLPLSLPGLAVGCTLVFSLTAGSFVTPAILGGTGAQMLGMLVDQQILVVYDWPFGATVASVLVAIVLAVNIVSMRILDRRRSVHVR
jgi:putative spermidine/putrescine transport system permease protein